jgi:hypothetical protein
MAYDRVKIFEQAKEVIVKHKLFFIDDICAFLPISRATFYDWDFDKLDELKGLLETNRIELKVSMRSKWYKSNAPALQMALMKLIATPEELRKLSMNHTVQEEVEKPIFKNIDLNVSTDNGTSENI